MIRLRFVWKLNMYTNISIRVHLFERNKRISLQLLTTPLHVISHTNFRPNELNSISTPRLLLLNIIRAGQYYRFVRNRKKITFRMYATWNVLWPPLHDSKRSTACVFCRRVKCKKCAIKFYHGRNITNGTRFDFYFEYSTDFSFGRGYVRWKMLTSVLLSLLINVCSTIYLHRKIN